MQVTGPELQTLWLNDYLDPSDRRSFPYMESLSRSKVKSGDRRVYGTGRLRSYSRSGQTYDWDVSFAILSPEDIDWLERHIDRTVIARDDRGRRISAVYYDVPVDELPYCKDATGSISLSEVTATLAV